MTKKEVVTKKETASAEPLKPKKLAQLDPTMLVRCYNNTAGSLYYESKRTAGYCEEWNEPGEYADIDLLELTAMARSQPAFFKENWIRIDDWEVLEYLRVDKYYNSAVYVEDVDSIFKLKGAALTKKLKELNTNAISFVLYKARKMIESGELDSMQTISALEKQFNCTLIERD